MSDPFWSPHLQILQVKGPKAKKSLPTCIEGVGWWLQYGLAVT